MSTVDVLFEGLNLNLLIERLKLKGVTLYQVNRLDAKRTVIRIKYKDLSKAFAISENMWYNTVLGYNGAIGFVKRLYKHLALIILSVIFIVASFLADNIIFGVEITNGNSVQKAQIYKLCSDLGLKKFTTFNSAKTKLLKEKLYTDCDGIGFATVKKWGNKLIIDPIYIKSPQSIPRVKSIVAPKSGTVIKLVVVSGTPMVKPGDTVNVGDVIVDGSATLSDGSVITQDAIASYQLKCLLSVEIVCDNHLTKQEVVTRSIFNLGLDSQTVLAVNLTPVIKTKNTVTYKVDITYLFIKEF